MYTIRYAPDINHRNLPIFQCNPSKLLVKYTCFLYKVFHFRYSLIVTERETIKFWCSTSFFIIGARSHSVDHPDLELTMKLRLEENLCLSPVIEFQSQVVTLGFLFHYSS